MSKMNKLRTHVMCAHHAFHLLGVHRGSTQQQISAARRELARQLHPDVNRAHDAGDLMACVNAAVAQLEAGAERYAAGLPGEKCTSCGGKGFTRRQKGFTGTVEFSCVSCHGAGKL